MSIWLSVDPLAQKYPTLSPYAFVANNPINLVDPDGRQIDPASQKDWNQHKSNVNQEYKNTMGQIGQAVAGMLGGKGAGGADLKGLGEKAGRLKGTLNTMGQAEASSQMYELDNSVSSGGIASTYYDSKSGNVVIKSDGTTSNFVHEVTHVGQFENQDLAFLKDGSNGAAAHDLYDEVSAYKNQYAYDPSSVSSISSSSSVSSMKDITTNWIQNINGGSIYGSYGLDPVNVYSPLSVLQKAYPGKFLGLPNNFNLSKVSSIHFKK